MCVQTVAALGHSEQFSSQAQKKLFPLCVREVCALALYSDCWHCPPLEHADSPFDILSTVRGNRPGKPVQLQEYEIKYLCTKAREIFITQPILLELEAPIKICGMAHENVAIMSLATLDAFSRRWHSWPVLWPPPTFWVRWFPAGSQLLVLGRLCRSRKTVLGNHLPAPCLQDQIPRKLFYSSWKSRVCKYQ